MGLATDPTCLLTVNLDLLVGPLAAAGSSASLLLPIPTSPSLAGFQLHFQGGQLELGTGEWNLSDQGTATVGL